jgi:hypothetical protein
MGLGLIGIGASGTPQWSVGFIPRWIYGFTMLYWEYDLKISRVEWVKLHQLITVSMRFTPQRANLNHPRELTRYRRFSYRVRVGRFIIGRKVTLSQIYPDATMDAPEHYVPLNFRANFWIPSWFPNAASCNWRWLIYLVDCISAISRSGFSQAFSQGHLETTSLKCHWFILSLLKLTWLINDPNDHIPSAKLLHKTMERSTILMGKLTISTGPFSIANC